MDLRGTEGLRTDGSARDWRLAARVRVGAERRRRRRRHRFAWLGSEAGGRANVSQLFDSLSKLSHTTLFNSMTCGSECQAINQTII